MGNVDIHKMQWINRPPLTMQNGGRLTVETEPFTFWRHLSDLGQGCEIQLAVKDNFIFTACSEFAYNTPFDQCGFLLYTGEELKAVFGTEKKDAEYLRLNVNVFYDQGGDRSCRDVGAALTRMYYRVLYRAGACKIQYSFAGEKYTDLREFHVDPSSGITAVGMYACSPKNSSFDCTFSEINLSEDRML